MKSVIKTSILLATVLLYCCFINISCGYDEIVDASYPESLIYLPIAAGGNISPNGIYTIDEGASTAWISPTPGQPLKYSVNRGSNRFVIPLGVYRSGAEGSLSESVTVVMSLDADTVSSLINEGKLTDTELLPSDKMQLPSSVNIEKGSNCVLFDLVADLDFLRQDAPKKYATGIRISSSTGTVNPTLNTGIIVLNTQITIPVADYSVQPKGSSNTIYSFTNTSLHWDFFSGENAFTWDFGDGTPLLYQTNPQHEFSATGEYTVTLTVRGITGELVSVSKPVIVK